MDVVQLVELGAEAVQGQAQLLLLRRVRLWSSEKAELKQRRQSPPTVSRCEVLDPGGSEPTVRTSSFPSSSILVSACRTLLLLTISTAVLRLRH